jgi:septal ring-binding cell division protein DamX
MNSFFARNRSARTGLLLVAALLILGVAAVAAQSGPNEQGGAALQGEGDNPLAPAEMAGQSPNDLAVDSAALDNGALESALAPGAQNPLPVEEMVGRSPNGDEATQDEPAAPAAPDAVAAAGGTRFLITTANVSGAAADTSCPAGFHMASLYELHDPTNLTYANIAGAKTRSDQGGGPVADWWGWVRTGHDASIANSAGQANCSNWTSSTAGEYGSLAQLSDTWTAAALTISPWQAQTWSCGGIAPVWCVAD